MADTDESPYQAPAAPITDGEPVAKRDSFARGFTWGWITLVGGLFAIPLLVPVLSELGVHSGQGLDALLIAALVGPIALLVLGTRWLAHGQRRTACGVALVAVLAALMLILGVWSFHGG